MLDQSRRETLILFGAGAGNALWGGRAFADAGQPPVRAGSADAYADTAELKTRLDAVARMTAPVRIGGQGPLQFVVDTGADHTAVSRATAESLKLEPGAPVTLHGVAGSVTADTVRLPSLQVGDRTFTDVVAPVLETADLGAAGLLGIDSLRDQRLLLDFKHTRMLIQGGRRYHTDPDEVVVRAKSRFGQLTLVDAWLRGEEVVVIIDSGAEGTIANTAFRDRATRARKSTDPADIEVVSVTGQSAWGASAFIPRLKLGGFTVRNLPVVYADLPTFARWGIKDDEPAMLLGVDVLRKFETVWIDFIRREVRFRLPAEATGLDRTSLA